jgi:3D (Asp-Asp-Asp) domain-containing protein
MRGRLAIGAAGALAIVAVTAALALQGARSQRPARPGSSTALAHPGLRSAAITVARRRLAHPAVAPARRTRHVAATATPPPAQSHCQNPAPPASVHPITHRQWLRGITITEYYPAPERWFVARRIHAPGLAGTHAADWLYSARGLAMEGQGIDLRGRPVHIAALGSTGWVNATGQSTHPVCLGKWTNGFPVWLIGGWRNRHGAVTFPLASGGWSNGRGVRVLPYGGVSFATGSSLPLRYYHSIAVDPRLIPLGSRVYIPAYRHHGSGWFVAQDTGGAIKSRHIDVYRPPPADPRDLGRYLTGQRILVIPPR